MDANKKCDQASFCVIDKNDVVSEEYTTWLSKNSFFAAQLHSCRTV